MQPHEERVVEELKDLMGKREKLGAFIAARHTFEALPGDEQERLGRQHIIMLDYEGVLQERIAAFPKGIGRG